MSLEIRVARVAEAQTMIDLIRESYPPSYLDLSAIGCTGTSLYVRNRIEVGSRDASTFVVAIEGDDMIGAAELKRRPDGMFVNHVVVAPGHQSQGVGGSILRFGVQSLQLASGDTVSLDVFEDNTAATRWYLRLGMRIASEHKLYRVDPQHATKGMWRIDGLPQCRLLLDTYGFGHCRIVTGLSDYSIGILDTGFVRTRGIAGDGAGIEALAHLWPESTILSEEEQPPALHQEYARTLRMNGTVKNLLDGVGTR